MKNITKVFVFGMCIPLLNGCFYNESALTDMISNLDLSSGKVFINYESHGGFQNDGVSCKGYKFSDNHLENEIKAKNNWFNSPFPEFVEVALFGNEQNGCLINKSNESTPLVSHIKNGYYSFKDRQGNINIDKFTNTYYSLNFSVAVYDVNNFTLYLCEFDS